jgi:hypothetical protein
MFRKLADVVQSYQEDPDIPEFVGGPTEAFRQSGHEPWPQFREFTPDRRNVKAVHPEWMAWGLIAAATTSLTPKCPEVGHHSPLLLE